MRAIDWPEYINFLIGHSYLYLSNNLLNNIDWPEIVILNDEIVDANDSIFLWLKENIGSDQIDWQVFYDNGTAIFRFKTPEDRTSFALRWVHNEDF